MSGEVPDTPNRAGLVVRVASSKPQLLKDNNVQSITEFMILLGSLLFNEDSNWGYLSKTPGEKSIEINGYKLGVDSFIYKPTQQVVDVLTNALDPGEAGTAWQHQPKRDNNNWVSIKQVLSSTGSSGGEDSKVPENAKIQELEHRISKLEAMLNTLTKDVLRTGDVVSLRAEANDSYVCTDLSRGEPVLIANRSEAYAWEEFEIKRRA